MRQKNENYVKYSIQFEYYYKTKSKLSSWPNKKFL